MRYALLVVGFLLTVGSNGYAQDQQGPANWRLKNNGNTADERYWVMRQLSCGSWLSVFRAMPNFDAKVLTYQQTESDVGMFTRVTLQPPQTVSFDIRRLPEEVHDAEYEAKSQTWFNSHTVDVVTASAINCYIYNLTKRLVDGEASARIMISQLVSRIEQQESGNLQELRERNVELAATVDALKSTIQALETRLKAIENKPRY